jgi:uncharacterized protein with PQ loop repeat
MIEMIALIASVALPLWNIPLIVRIIQRKSSEDISLPWALGVWVCTVMMFPQAITSDEFVWKIFSVINLVTFSGVTGAVLFYRRKVKAG